jgi:Uma2 family endonuclease
MSMLYQWTIEDYEALATVGERVFTDWRHPRHIELICGYLKEGGKPARVSVDEYLNMVEEGIFSRREKIRVELICEEIRKMAPIGEPHEEAVTFLDEWSHQVAPKNVKIRVQCSVALPTARSVPEPDLVWAVRREYRSHKPGPKEILLVIEVADTTLVYDTGEKAEIYAAAGISDYWVVNIPDNVVEVRRNPGRKGYRSLVKYSGRKKISPLCCEKAVLVPQTIWE